ncbi:MAG: hypothetical protein WD512_12280 [Candidatus Paceibacterota bacterium]
MTFYNLNGVTINLEKFVSAHVLENTKPKGFCVQVKIRSTKSSKKIKRITSLEYTYRLDAINDISLMIDQINALPKQQIIN